mmetsp:Transcript_34542/g.52842  ORF Transcript_34542/g.52842 Transcript_34542/m.52842 type:complete len:207 (+) Transcript_34542:1571-2191(+)
MSVLESSELGSRLGGGLSSRLGDRLGNMLDRLGLSRLGLFLLLQVLNYRLVTLVKDSHDRLHFSSSRWSGDRSRGSLRLRLLLLFRGVITDELLQHLRSSHSSLDLEGDRVLSFGLHGRLLLLEGSGLLLLLLHFSGLLRGGGSGSRGRLVGLHGSSLDFETLIFLLGLLDLLLEGLGSLMLDGSNWLLGLSMNNGLDHRVIDLQL